MAIVFEASYGKKLGLPNFSSHQYSVTVRMEVADIGNIQAESSRVYRLLQDSVDRDIQNPGFLPRAGESKPGNGGNGGNGHSSHTDGWACSERQKALILNIVEENQLDKQEVESLALERFGQGVKELNKLEASGLIEELLEKYSPKDNGRTLRRYPSRQFRRGAQ